MFEPSETPRLFGLAPGVDFPRALVAGLLARFVGTPPEALARVEIFVNTHRMQRRLRTLFDEGPARLLPRIRLVTDLAEHAAFAGIPQSVSPLRLRLELTQLISGLLEQEPDLAPRSALFDLADSLAKLMDEMQGEGVTPDALRSLDVSDQSGHWQRSLRFVRLVDAFFGAEKDRPPDIEARQRRVIEALADRWAVTPPQHPVLVAGSTGSRGATALFMRTVARLPQGAVILPGVDFDMPAHVWTRLRDAMTGEDHPQFRFARLLHDLGQGPEAIQRWHDTDAPCPARNRLVSLALRPAPVTDQWMTDGGQLGDIGAAARDMTLIEAPSSRAEASAIALALRGAVEDGRVAALITPDRELTRQVTAALDRWRIVPDDSAGRPLPLSAPGRLLRHVARLFGQKLTAEALLVLLKHPLTNTGSAERGAHLKHTRELELRLRKDGPPFPTPNDLFAWAMKGDADRQDWVAWLAPLLDGLETVSARPLEAHLDHHVRLAEGLAQGPTGTDGGELWKKEAGIEARTWVDALRAEAEFGGTLSTADYASLFDAVLQRGEVRESETGHPGVMIWGTLEARVQGAELVILGSLNEGVWPEQPSPDPWLNRRMRHDAGLLLPDRRIGLSAHDFQQAVAATEVILTRSVRDSEAQTVPSRWLNRMINLMDGVSEAGAEALKGMRSRGARWLAMAERLDSPDTKTGAAPRPSPRPPVGDRPRELSITEIQTLIRDPYAVYARRILGLQPIDPLRHTPDAPLRGTVLHKVFELFIGEGPVRDPVAARTRLIEITDAVLQAEAPWPAARRMWRAKLLRVADWFIEGEIARQAAVTPVVQERKGALWLPDLDLTLKGKVDRIDRTADGQLAIYDYKTGKPPTEDQQRHFDKQLFLAAIMAEEGAFKGLDAAKVREVAYIGLGASPSFEPVALQDGDLAQVLRELRQLIASYRRRETGYTSRRAIERKDFGREYDHLARFGEWDESFAPEPQEVG
jgi:double-strand break repair protein AddB